MAILLEIDALPNGGSRMPPSGATVGDDTIGTAAADCRYLSVRCWGSIGVGGTAWTVPSLG